MLMCDSGETRTGTNPTREMEGQFHFAKLPQVLYTLEAVPIFPLLGREVVLPVSHHRSAEGGFGGRACRCQPDSRLQLRAQTCTEKFVFGL